MKRIDPNLNPRRSRCPGCESTKRVVVSPLAGTKEGRSGLRKAGLLYWSCPACGRHVWRVNNPKGFPKPLALAAR